MLFQPQNDTYKEYSDAYKWGLIYGAVGVSEIALNAIERALTAASSACDGAGKHTVAQIRLRHGCTALAMRYPYTALSLSQLQVITATALRKLTKASQAFVLLCLRGRCVLFLQRRSTFGE